MKAILRVILLLGKFGRHSPILLSAVGYAYSSFFSSVKCSYTRSRSQRSSICTKRHLLQWWYTCSELVLKNSKGLHLIYIAWTRNFTNMDLILMKVFTFTDRSNSAVEAVSAHTIMAYNDLYGEAAPERVTFFSLQIRYMKG